MDGKVPATIDSQVPILGGGSTTLLVPRALPGLPPFSFDMSEVYRIEQRIPELKVVNLQTYVELAGEFNVAYNILSKCISAIGFEISTLENEMEKLKGRLLIDEYPEFLAEMKAKGLGDNQDLRKAFLTRDKTFAMSTDKLSAMKAIEGFLVSKQRSFLNSHRAAKKVVDAKRGGGHDVY